MKADYLRDLSSDIVTQHVKLSLPDPGAAIQGPLLFLEATVPDSHLPLHSIPLLADTGATNLCISISTLLTLGLSKNDICTEVQYLLTNVTESVNKNAIIGSIILQTEIKCTKGFASLSIHFLVLDTSLDYAILGSLELENAQSVICM